MNENINLFEYATRNKLRFESTKGVLTVEQLWDVPLTSTDGCNLDAIAKGINRQVKDATEESFVSTKKTAATVQLEMKLEVVKSIISTKITDAEVAKTRADRKKEKELLLAALAEKQAGELSELNVKELKKRIAALED